MVARAATLLVLLAVALGTWASPASAANYLAGDSVNGKEQVLVEDQTTDPRGRAAMLFAIEKWGALDCYWGPSCEGVEIREATPGENPTVTVRTPDRESRYNGYWSNKSGADVINLFPNGRDDITYQHQSRWNILMVHEFGHALRLAHSDCPASERRSVMAVYSVCFETSDGGPSEWDRDVLYYKMWIVRVN